MVVANPMHNSSRVRNIHTVVGVRDSSQKKQHQQKHVAGTVASPFSCVRHVDRYSHFD